jgi:hypothetical protein
MTRKASSRVNEPPSLKSADFGGVALIREVGAIVIAFGAKSLFDAADGAMRRTA